MHLSRLYSAPPAPLARGKLAGEAGSFACPTGNLAPFVGGLAYPTGKLALLPGSLPAGLVR
jgi:hypothetical protein